MKTIFFKIILIISVIFLLQCNTSSVQKGQIYFNLPELQNRFDAVVVEMKGYEILGDSTFISDTLKIINGVAKYDFKLDQPKITSIFLLKNKKKSGKLFFQYPNKDKSFYGNILLGNEFIQVHSFISDLKTDDIIMIRVKLDGAKENEISESIRQRKITKVLIENNSKSFAVLYELFWGKEDYKNNELSKLITLLDDDLKTSGAYIKLEGYLKKKINLEKNGYSTGFNWKDIDGKKHNFDSVLQNKEYVLLVFWASWCGPCRAEIPALIKFQKEYGNNLALVSLSIDDDYENWKKAVEKEQMPWLNLSGLPESTKAVKEKYNISAVPTLVLLNKEGEILVNSINDLNLIKNAIRK
jgi:thiol-disulfide isomerase/thioredoxin